MPNLQVLNQNGEAVGEVTLAENIFAIEPNKQSIFDAIQVHLANRRQDTSKTKTRDEVSGSGKKPWRQKGTGRARQGSIRSP
jgi:large subunit ribosomal protein L4